MQPRRFVATVLFTDIVGSTERAAELGDRAWRGLLAKHHALVRRELQRFGGREIGTAGDGFLAIFASPERAIRCACSLRDAVRELDLEIRSGLHMGQIEETGGTIGGISVHIGARVAAHAGEGEVLVSSTVRDAEVGSGFAFEDRGIHPLKGVPGEWRLFAVAGLPAGEALTPSAWEESSPRPARTRVIAAVLALLLLALAGYVALRMRHRAAEPEQAAGNAVAPGIAVLPFSVNDPSLDRWREGMVDVLSTNLDGAAGFRAIDSRTVLARWRERTKANEAPDLPVALDVARRTGARYAVVGEAIGSGTDVRFAADVYDLESGSKLGQSQVEGSPDSIFRLVDRLSIDLLREVSGRTGEGLTRPSLARVTTSSVPALKAYLDGEARMRRGDFKGAIPLYQQALEADSTFALALYKLTEAHGWAESYDTCAVCEPYMERAAQLADRLTERERLIVRGNLALIRGTLDGIPLLKEAVAKYPDDAEAWALLAETYSHLGERALVHPDEASQAFAKAAELDPAFSPAYIHPFEEAQFRLDTARAERLLEAYARVAAGSEQDRMNRVGYALTFGDPAAREAALAALDTFSLIKRVVVSVTSFSHPRFHAERDAALARVGRDPEWSAQSQQFRLYFNVFNGRFRRALALRDSVWADDPPAGWMYFAHVHGLPLAREELDRVLAPPPPSDTSRQASQEAFSAGAYAADRARWQDIQAMVSRLRRDAPRALAAGDSLRAEDLQASAQALEAYDLWKRDQPERALELLQAAQPLAMSHEELIRWWLGQLLVELGQLREAERYFRSLRLDPLFRLHLARIYEELGDYRSAREAYEFVLAAWQDADPELQPQVEEARKAVARLRSVIRE